MHVAAIDTTRAGERRTPVTPASVAKLVAAGHQVTVQAGIGDAAGASDRMLEEAGAGIGVADSPDLIVTVGKPEPGQIAGAAAVLGFLEPLDSPTEFAALATTGATLFAFELVPRTTRAQTVDALSSQATISGYEAVLEAARHCRRIFPMMTTAAGTLRPSTVLVMGAGVAGLQSIATARRLGAVVWGFDVRAAAAEQVESLGARFVHLDLEAQDETASGGYARELEVEAETRMLSGLYDHVVEADAVVTAAAVPGRPAPRLVTEDMVRAMQAGSVVVDGAADTGGNCDLTRPGEVVVEEGVTISGPLDLPSRAAAHASQLYARNVTAFVDLVTDDDQAGRFETADDVVAAATAARDGEVIHQQVLESLQRIA